MFPAPNVIKSNFVVFFDTVLDTIVVLGVVGPLRQPKMYVAPDLSSNYVLICDKNEGQCMNLILVDE